jgi:hypothetical protein
MFPKQDKCTSMKIRTNSGCTMTEQMFDFGIGCFRQFQRYLVDGGCSGKDGIVYSNKWYYAYCKKTKSGMASILVYPNEGD